MKSSTKTGVSGARHHSKIVTITPVENKIFRFMLRARLTECYIITSTGSLARNILYIYINSVINGMWNLL